MLTVKQCIQQPAEQTAIRTVHQHQTHRYTLLELRGHGKNHSLNRLFFFHTKPLKINAHLPLPVHLWQLLGGRQAAPRSLFSPYRWGQMPKGAGTGTSCCPAGTWLFLLAVKQPSLADYSFFLAICGLETRDSPVVYGPSRMFQGYWIITMPAEFSVQPILYIVCTRGRY